MTPEKRALIARAKRQLGVGRSAYGVSATGIIDRFLPKGATVEEQRAELRRLVRYGRLKRGE